MKKGLKVLICLLAIIGIGVGGFAVHQHQEKEKMIKIATSEEAKKVYEEHMKANDPKALTEDGIIKTYEIDTESLYYNPMGGIEVRLYFNSDKKLDFHFGLIENDKGQLESSGYTISPKLSKLLKGVK
ncbi:DUF1310 family protein [Streptococcus ferus]|uniref:Lmo2807 protein n=1 Tax=Streptococcus ferus TaxID=1345 RepID=A0A2X3VTQ1_9STRE|nr:DUF1310 family protein [Streptococcus ferus]SQF41115.1 Lmo2807 protein [Streptococcus ferus]